MALEKYHESSLPSSSCGALLGGMLRSAPDAVAGSNLWCLGHLTAGLVPGAGKFDQSISDDKDNTGIKTEGVLRWTGRNGGEDTLQPPEQRG